jgi:hypothetical protein
MRLSQEKQASEGFCTTHKPLGEHTSFLAFLCTTLPEFFLKK